MERIISAPKKIKGKLITTVCMLLVAAVMLATTSYAWFALSTAPEVTGINTSIGANGALEIWLNDGGDIDSGNIVRLGAEYGLDQIILLPSVLDNTDGQLGDGYLLVPQYNADGYYDGVNQAGSAFAGTLVGDNFFANDGTGVRGVGSASGMTPRETAYRNAKNAASTNSKLASAAAAGSLNTHGGALGTILVTKVANNYADSDVVYTLAQGYALYATVDALDKALGYIENAYEQMLIALSASALVTPDIYATVKADFESGELTIGKIVENDGITIDGTTVPLGDTVMTALTKLNSAMNKVAAAKAACTAAGLPTAEPAEEDAATNTYSWEQIEGIVSSLIVMENAELNGTSLTGSFDYNELAQSVLGDGVKITLKAGSGIYADIAEHSGNFSATVTMTNVQAGAFNIPTITANMATTSAPDPTYLNAVSAAVNAAGAPAGATVGDLPMTSFYGFIIDLGFRTNAQNSNLLLQSDPVDRIYKDNEEGTATQGAGSYMTYKAVTNELTTDQVKGLMACIRIIFFDTDENTFIGEARLDVDNSTISTDGVTAKMYMFKDNALQNGTDTNNDSAIVGLTMNAQTHVSVLVYLDGAELENEDVAATDVQSVVGKMNIQFASDAELKPMDYGDLYSPVTPNTPEVPDNPESGDVTVEHTGNITDNITWTLYSDGLLKFEGTGAMPNFSASSDGPWYGYRESITAVEIGEGITYLGLGNLASIDYAEITIPESVAAIAGHNGWGGQYKTVHYAGSEQQWNAIAIFDPNNTLIGGTLNAEQGNASILHSGTIVSTDISWTLYADGVLTISGIGAMPDWGETSTAPWDDYATSVKHLIISDGITNVGSYAFDALTDLQSVKIAGSVTVLGEYAFSECRNLLAVVIGEGSALQRVDRYCFNWCANLRYINMPDTVNELGALAFACCEALDRIMINGVTTMGDDTFFACESLTSITLAEGLRIIPDGVFARCFSLSEVTIPSTVIKIGTEAFFVDDDSIIKINYAGSSEQWALISIGYRNNGLDNAVFTFGAAVVDSGRVNDDIT